VKPTTNIEQLFQEAFKQYEAPVGEQIWQGIESQLQAPAASVAGSSAMAGNGAAASVAVSSGWVTTLLVVVGLAGITAGGYYFFNETGEKRKSNKEVIQPAETEETVDTKEVLQEPEVIEEVTEPVVNPKEESDKQKEKVTSKAAPNKKSENPKRQSVATQQSILKNEGTTTATETEKTVSTEMDKDSERTDSPPPIYKADKNPIAENGENINKADDNKTNNQLTGGDGDQLPANNDKGDSTVTDVPHHQLDKEFPLSKKFPNVFTPNQDGRNDVFTLSEYEDIEKVDEIEVMIFDRHQNKVTGWKGKYGVWDGRLRNGSPAESGTYFCITKIRIGDQWYVYQNSVYLNRD
jgi:gliding motility-associated-like protein